MTSSMLENSNQLILSVRDFNGSTRAFFILVELIGLLFALKFVLATIQAFRLYVLSQLCCCSNNYTLRYGQWVVITGATDGIGLAMARQFARRGHSLLVVGRNDQKLARTKALLESEPNVSQVETIQIDLADSSTENYERIRGQLDKNGRDIGILVNNAGIATQSYMRYADFELESIRNTVNVNILAVAFFTRMVLPGMLARKRGLILNVSSLAGELRSGYVGVYGPTKAFVNSFGRILELEYSAHHIDLMTLAPGPVNTNMLAYLKFRGSSWLVPSADNFARAAVGAIGTRTSFYSGWWGHGVMRVFCKCCDSLGLLHGVFLLYIRWKNMTLPPVQREKL